MIRILQIILLVVSLATAPLQSKAQPLATTIKVQAMEMGNAFMRNNFNDFVKYMHPEIIAFAGGRESMREKMDSAYLAMKRFRVRFKRYWIGDPGEIVNHKGQLQALLPQSTTLITALGQITMETTMIVISNDKGKNWWFIDTNVYKSEKLKNILPDLSPRLVIPEPKKPRLEKLGN